MFRVPGNLLAPEAMRVSGAILLFVWKSPGWSEEEERLNEAEQSPLDHEIVPSNQGPFRVLPSQLSPTDTTSYPTSSP